MHFSKAIALIILACLGAGCTTTGQVRQSIGVETVAADKALAFPPPGGPAIVNVVERRHAKDVEQTISLFTSSSVPGQNFLKVQFLGIAGSNPGLGSRPFDTVSEGAIAREMAAAIPGVRLARSAIFVQNGYGPFGYASGQSRAGDTCLYAWQQVKAGFTPSQEQRNFGMVQVRIRLCDALATERQLLSTVYGYTITGHFAGAALNPFGGPRGADAVLGKPGELVYPDATTYRTAPIGIGYPNHPAAARPVVIRRPAVTQPQPQVQPTLPPMIGPRVPLPDGQSAPPQTNGASGPTSIAQPPSTNTASNIIVPLPDCNGEAGISQGCR
ncbi:MULTISPECIES: cellulose biosynthesis protein BcsN [unclassified Rhizobium]|uniref:cellulose biosynthesis protein BcsN n=1 Tax=unclassified Rhizobium TaxID=2613769 RepID=UPI000EA89CC2|nr:MULTISPECIES: cellulose biosynthesis protein BcsN [unclassified Rhizobium]AYG69575.1 cellulose biosynthesis protein BcsN [Rhizobium sp. CCGE531]AYG75953.1 cellulose biosynthesis protein BcsN [Rhizobium sp. CCGE532]